MPRRLAAGKTLIIADNTKVFLSVIRKRWMKLLYEVECQRSSTLDKIKREALQDEVDQMRNCRFASKPPAEIPDANVAWLTRNARSCWLTWSGPPGSLSRSWRNRRWRPVSVRSTGRTGRVVALSDRLSEQDVRAIAETIEARVPQWKIAEQYGISLSSVKRILRKHRRI